MSKLSKQGVRHEQISEICSFLLPLVNILDYFNKILIYMLQFVTYTLNIL